MSQALVERLRSPDPAERRAACRDAARDPEAAGFLEALAQVLGDPDPSVARAASEALAALAGRVGRVREVLRQALRGDAPTPRLHAAFALARIEPPSPALLPALVEALGCDEPALRWAAARLLVGTGRLHGEVLPLVLGLVRTSEAPRVRRMATFCLRELAPDRPEAARVLLAATHDPVLPVRRAAFTALAGLIDPPREVVARLGEALECEPDGAIRCIAATALGELGAAEPAAIPRGTVGRLSALREQAENPELRRAAQRALARLGAEGSA